MDSTNKNNTYTKDLETSPSPICRDYLKGRCDRKICKFSHTPVILAKIPSTATENSNTTCTTCNISYCQQDKPTPFLSSLYIPTKGHIFLNLNDFSQQTQYNGLFICNLTDIIPVEYISNLINLYGIGTYIDAIKYTDIRNLICKSFNPNWIVNIRKILDWSRISTPDFPKNNYSTVFMYDISSATRKLVLSNRSQFNKKSLFKKSNVEITSSLLYYLNCVFTYILFELETDANKLNIIVNYMNDELGLRTRGPIEFLYSLITSNTGKYINVSFATNIYYIGKSPDLFKTIGKDSNKGIVFCYVSGIKYIDLESILDTESSKNITTTGNTDIGNYIMTYNSYLNLHNTRIYNMLFDKNSQLKKTLINAIPVSNIRPKTLIIIGANLDVEFDKDIITGLKETIGSFDFTAIASRSTKKPTEIQAGPNHSGTNKKAGPSKDSCCSEDNNDSPSTTTMSVILPIITSNSSNQNPSASLFNEVIQELFGGKTSSSIGKPSSNTNNLQLIRNQICTIGLNLVTSYNCNISASQPFDTIPGIEKIKEYGMNPSNKIILLCSAKLTHTYFQEFIQQITRTPGYPAKISANFIDYDINPSLRACLGFHTYRSIVKNYFCNPMSGEVPVIQLSKLDFNFMNYISTIHPEYTKNKTQIDPQLNPQLNPQLKTDMSEKTNQTNTPSECCDCCNCLSRHGIGYSKFGNIPYIPLEILNKIIDDSWLPRF